MNSLFECFLHFSVLATADSTIYGCILTCDFGGRTCDVKWFTREGLELSTESDVSVYDIAEHADFVFNAGDVVVRMVPPDYCTSPSSSSGTCVGQVWLSCAQLLVIKGSLLLKI